MAYTDAQKAQIEQFKSQYIAANSLPLVSAQWTYAQGEAYLQALAAFIANGDFPRSSKNLAYNVLEKGPGELEEYTLAEMAGDFLGTAFDQAADLNPFSEENRLQTALFVAGGLVLAVVAMRLVDNVSKR
jgi:hypothetical protein